MKIDRIALVLSNLIPILTTSCTNSPTTQQEKVDYITNDIEVDTTDKQFIGELGAKQILNGFLNNPTTNLLQGRVLIKTKQQLIAIAEPILFEIYGRESTIKEKPYEIYLLGDYWVMLGTLKKGSKGGTFSFVMNRKTAEIIGINAEE